MKARPLIDLVLRLGAWAKGEHIVEIGAGMGHYAEQIRRRGFEVTALESDVELAERAARQYPKLRVEQTPARHLHPGTKVDHVYVREPVLRGGEATAAAEHVFEWIRPGGTFVAQLHTDDPAQTSDHQRLLEQFGSIVAVTDWSGAPIRTGVRHDRGVVLVVRVSTMRERARGLFEEGASRVRRVRTG